LCSTGVAIKEPLLGWLVFKHVAGDLDAIAEAFFCEYMADVIFDRSNAYAKLCSYVFVAESTRYGFGHAPFGFSQLLVIKYDCLIQIKLAYEPRHLGASSLNATKDGCDYRKQFIRLEGLRYVCINSRAKAFYAVRPLIFCREKYDRH
jgi:hypothetical protein